MVAKRGGGALRRHPAAPGYEGARAGGRALRRHPAAPERDPRRDGDGSPPCPVPRFRRPRALLLSRRRGGRPARRRDLRLRESADAQVRRDARHRVPAHEHHPRRRRGRAQGPHLPAAGRAGAVRRPGRRHPARAADRGLRPSDGVPDRPRAGLLRAARSRCCRPRTASRSGRASSWRPSTGRCSTRSGATARACSRTGSRSRRSASSGSPGERGSPRSGRRRRLGGAGRGGDAGGARPAGHGLRGLSQPRRPRAARHARRDRPRQRPAHPDRRLHRNAAADAARRRRSGASARAAAARAARRFRFPVARAAASRAIAPARRARRSRPG